MSISHCATRAGALVRALLILPAAALSLHASAAAAANPVLTISGAPALIVTPPSYYSFVPLVQNSAGRPLIFSIANKPWWLQFEPATGRLFGGVTRGDVGAFAKITIAVSDGISRAVLPSFAIRVRPDPNRGMVTLQWEPPTQNTDSSPLLDLAGYHIYYGASPGAMTNSLSYSNPGIASYVVAGLDPGTWYFAVAAYNSTGVEGEMSEVISWVTQ